MNKLLMAVGMAVGMIFPLGSPARADRVCETFSPKEYDTLRDKTVKNDSEAMFRLGYMYCNDCALEMDHCETGLNWLKGAAEAGHQKARALVQSFDHEGVEDLLYEMIHLNGRIKSGDYLYRDYKDGRAYYAHYEILRDGHMVFAEEKQGRWYTGTLYEKGLFGDGIPTLAVSLETEGTAKAANILYYSLGTELDLVMHLTIGSSWFVKDYMKGGPVWTAEDRSYRYWYAAGYHSPIPPRVMMRFKDGKLVLAKDLMKRPVPPEYIMQNWLKQLRGDESENKDWENWHGQYLSPNQWEKVHQKP